MIALCLLLAVLPAPMDLSDSNQSFPRLGTARHGFALASGGRVLRAGLWHPVTVDVHCETAQAGGVWRLVAEGLDPWGVPARSERVLPALMAGDQRAQVFSPLAGSWARPVQVWLEEVATGKKVSTARVAEEEVRSLANGATLVLVVGRPLPELNRALVLMEKPQAARTENTEAEVEPAAGLVQVATVESLPESHLGYGGVDLVVLQPDAAWLENWLEPRNAGRRQALALWLARGGNLLLGMGPAVVEKMEILGRELGAGGGNPLPVVTRPGGVERRLPVSGISRWVGGNLPPLLARSLPAWDLTDPAHADTLAAEPVPGQPSRPVLVQAGAGRGWICVSAVELESPANDKAPQEKEIWLAFWRKLLGDHGLPRPAQVQGSPLMDDLADTGMGVLPFGWVVLWSLIFLGVAGPLDYLLTTRVLQRPEATWWTFPIMALAAVAGAIVLTRGLHGDQPRHRRLDLVDLVVSGQPGITPSWAGGTTLAAVVDPARGVRDWNLALEPGWLGELDESWTGPGGPWLHEDRPRPGPVVPARVGYRFGVEAATATGLAAGPGAERIYRAEWLARMSEPAITARLAMSRTSGHLEGVIESQLPVDLEQVVVLYGGRATLVGDLPGRGGRVRVEIHRVGDAGETGETWRLKIHQDAGYVAGARSSAGREAFKRDALARLEPLLFARPEAEDALRSTGLGWDQAWRVRQAGGKWRNEAVLVGQVAGGGGGPALIGMGGPAGMDPLPGAGVSVTLLRAFLPVEMTAQGESKR